MLLWAKQYFLLFLFRIVAIVKIKHGIEHDSEGVPGTRLEIQSFAFIHFGSRILSIDDELEGMGDWNIGAMVQEVRDKVVSFYHSRKSNVCLVNCLWYAVCCKL